MYFNFGCGIFFLIVMCCLVFFIAGCVYKIAFPAEYALIKGKIDAWFASVPEELWWLIGSACLLWCFFGGKPQR